MLAERNQWARKVGNVAFRRCSAVRWRIWMVTGTGIAESWTKKLKVKAIDLRIKNYS